MLNAKTTNIFLIVKMIFLLINTILYSDENNVNKNEVNQFLKIKLILTTPDYKITPGDRFVIEYSNRREELFVDFSYNITSNAFGSILTKGLTLKMLKNLVTEKMKKQVGKDIVYKFDMIDYGIYNVLVRGEVQSTKFISGCGIDRLDYYFSNAGITQYSSSRKIKIIRNSKELYFDLFLYNRYGDLKQNPIINPNDIIEITKADKKITITGAIYRQGEYELLPNENIEDLLNYANGFTEEAYPEFTRVSSILEESPEYVSKYVNLKTDKDIILHNRDNIYVYDRSIIQPVVFIEGAIKGIDADDKKDDQFTIDTSEVSQEEKYLTIRINKGERLLDVIAKVGGLDQGADLKNAYIVRSKVGENIFKIYLYDLLYKNDMSKNIEIYNLDKIVIPSRSVSVGVLGMVKNPQLFSYERNKSVLYYIQKAGGVIPINGNNSIFWLIRKGDNRPKRILMSKAESIIICEGDRIEIKPSGLYWSNSIFPTINSFLGLTIGSSNLVLNLTDFYYRSISQSTK